MKKQQSEPLTKLEPKLLWIPAGSFIRLKHSGRSGFSIIIFFLFLSLVSCENDIKTINSLTMIDSLPLEYFRDIEVTYSDSGKIQAFLKSPYMIRVESKDPFMEFPEGFQAIFYDSLHRPKSEIKANYGISYEDKKIMEARNNVIVKNIEKGERLDTEHLIWDRKKSTFYSDVFVKITRADEVLYGDGLTSDQNFDRYTIKNPTGEFEINPDEEKNN
ncbi:MAG: LPS export ABC transporter periplasmic protein LptC [Bacteroidales bacterium]|nr:LPS export ABC transporter periplasmic protein LptC [Bacteroidales bacterium]